MNQDARSALFLLLGQTADRVIAARPEVAPADSIAIGQGQDLADLLPAVARRALQASMAFKLFFVFENYLRELVVETLSEGGANWWDQVPTDVQTEVEKLEEAEETKSWMALGARDKSALLTYPQILRVMEHCWKDQLSAVVRDRALVQEARGLTHLRNTISHMTAISEEEEDRVRQVMRDWFRMVAP